MDQTTSTLPEKAVNDITSNIHGMHPRPSGYGGQSDVYAAFWESPGGHIAVAIKVLRVAGIPDTKIRKRLEREISLWGRLQHRNVQTLLGVCTGLSSLPAMVSEWQNNGDITSYLNDLKTRSCDPALQNIKYDLLIEVLDGVKYLHAHDIVHGDIKGANVLIANNGSARLCDFGFSIILTEHSGSRSQWSAAKGTIRWMAPEFFDEDDRLAIHTRASDIWALGCLIIEVQTGGLPYSTKRSDHKVILAISRRESPALQPFKPDALWQLMLHCCEVEPAARYTTLQLLSGLRIQRLLRSLVLPARHDPHFWDRLYTDGNKAFLDIVNHLHDCELSHSPIQSVVGEVLVMICRRLNSQSRIRADVRLIAEAACDLLAVCVHVAQQPPTDTAIHFLVNTVPHLLRFIDQLKHEISLDYMYPADDLRPLAKIISEHGDASMARFLMRDFAIVPGCFEIGCSIFSNIAWSGDGALFAFANDDSVVIIQPNKVPSITLPAIESYGSCIAISPDGQHVACSRFSDRKVTVSLWDIPSQSALDIRTMPAIGAMRDLVFSQDGLCFAFLNGGNDGRTIYVWRVGKNPVQLDMPPGTLPSDALAFTADSHIIVAGQNSRIRTLSLWDLDTTALVSVLEITAPLYGFFTALGSQGRYLMLPGRSGATLCLYDTASGRLVCILKADKKTNITCAATSLDGAYAAAGTPEGFVYVWDVETTTLLENSPLPIHRDAIARLTFTSDGTKIITSTRNGEVCVSDIRGSWLRWDV